MTSSTSSTLAGSSTVCPFTVVPSAGRDVGGRDGQAECLRCGQCRARQATEAVSALIGSPAVVCPGMGPGRSGCPSR